MECGVVGFRSLFRHTIVSQLLSARGIVLTLENRCPVVFLRSHMTTIAPFAVAG